MIDVAPDCRFVMGAVELKGGFLIDRIDEAREGRFRTGMVGNGDCLIDLIEEAREGR